MFTDAVSAGLSEVIVTMVRDDEVRLEAYRIWLDEGGVHGRDQDHWRQAEARLRHAAAEDAPDRRGDGAAPAMLIETAHRTVLYLDLARRAVRHAALDTIADAEAIIRFEADGLRIATLPPEDTIALDAKGVLVVVRAEDEDASFDCAIERRDAVITLEFDTGFLSAEPGGTLVANRPVVAAWERFRLVQPAA